MRGCFAWHLGFALPVGCSFTWRSKNAGQPPFLALSLFIYLVGLIDRLGKRYIGAEHSRFGKAKQLDVYSGGLLNTLAENNILLSSFSNCLGQVRGGLWHMLSPLTNAQTPGNALFAQMSEFVCLQPTVCVALSRVRSGA